MKIFFSILFVFLLALSLCFALSNRTEVNVALSPFAGTVSVPLCVVGLVPLAAGIFVGSLWGWLGGIPHRARARRLHKELDALNTKIGDLQKAAVVQHASVAAKKPFWRFK